MFGINKLKSQLAYQQGEISRLRWGVENPRKFRNRQRVKLKTTGVEATVLSATVPRVYPTPTTNEWLYSVQGANFIVTRNEDELSPLPRTKPLVKTVTKNKKQWKAKPANRSSN